MSSPKIGSYSHLPSREPFPSRAVDRQNSLPSEPASRTEHLGAPPKWGSRPRSLQKGGLVAPQLLGLLSALGKLKQIQNTDRKIGNLPGSSFPGPSNAKL